ncbi:MAG: hypothetical protein ABWX60_11805, partial [Aeromicrobium sp.]
MSALAGFCGVAGGVEDVVFFAGVEALRAAVLRPGAAVRFAVEVAPAFFAGAFFAAVVFVAEAFF